MTTGSFGGGLDVFNQSIFDDACLVLCVSIFTFLSSTVLFISSISHCHINSHLTVKTTSETMTLGKLTNNRAVKMLNAAAEGKYGSTLR